MLSHEWLLQLEIDPDEEVMWQRKCPQCLVHYWHHWDPFVVATEMPFDLPYLGSGMDDDEVVTDDEDDGVDGDVSDQLMMKK